jgi:thiamine-phosphate pyrophosphorylase
VDVDAARQAGWAPRDLADAYLSGGVRFLQIRAKTLASGPFLELADAVVGDARSAAALVIVNDRADIATLAGAAGVHVGQDDLTPSDARRLVGSSALVGISTHTREQIEAARQMPVSYVAVGPVFGTATKDTGYRAVGLDLVRDAGGGGQPIVAIGGITLENAQSVLDAGATSVAVISDLMTHGDPEARAREWVARLDRRRHPPA